MLRDSLFDYFEVKSPQDVFGGRALILPLDVSDAAAIDRAAEQVERELGPIDVWVNDAMASVFSPVSKMTAADYRRVTEVTYLGVVNGTLAALRHMLPRDRGTIVQVGSALAYRGIPLQSAYCGAKHAIQGFSESLRSELIHDASNVKVTMVQLPAVNTPQFDWSKSRMPRKAQPVPPIYQPEVPARAIHYAAHHYRREWNLGLMTDVVLMGNSVAPGLGDYYLAETGYDGQMTDEPEDPDRPNNLYEPVPGDRGAHGRFDARAHADSQQWWVTKNRGWLAAAVGIAGLFWITGRKSA
ncbi:MAG TPA: SDR family oxidoreductase [Pirellulales bacterium]|jgi:NAD(P)-dependent dehydrogenase (short-subunit alcohol dehydrogenase family)|nr:SDR family oxidoreductase [Pirellulales bacterium]